MTETDPREHSRFINRELSWLEFNQRVLDEAFNEENPLLERLKFLCITASNLDEFFEVRVAGLQQQRQSEIAEGSPDGMSPAEQLTAISSRVRRFVDDQYSCWADNLKPALEQESICFLHPGALDAERRSFLEKYFYESVHPVLTPLAIDPVHPFPQLLNKSLNILVKLGGKGLTTDLAVIQVPRILPRLIHLPGGSGNEFVFIAHVIAEFAHSLFHGVLVESAHSFRVTRNSNLYFDEEEVENLLSTIESELRKSNRGNAVRLEVEGKCPPELVERLLSIFNLTEDDLYWIHGPINLMRVMAVLGDIDRPDLKFRPFRTHRVLPPGDELEVYGFMRNKPVLLHHPYDSFGTVVDFIASAAEDPAVLAIKQTLYRTSGDTPIVPALMEASRNGKQVTVIIELKARFDEAANIKWAKMLQEAGVNVVYGLMGLKTHCKAALVVRQEGMGIRRYVHLGTGNYHPSTARLYTDIGILTADQEIAADVAELFNLLTGVSVFPGMKKLLVAPFNLHEQMVAMIRAEKENALEGKAAGIYAIMNSLVDEEVIRELYEASGAGVSIRLLVRGICCLRSGVPGLSENIEVRSVVGRFLEHSRVYRFENAGDPKVFIGSADWMPRNFFRRVEVCTPLEDEDIRRQVTEILDLYWRDTAKARVQSPDGTYHTMESPGDVPFNAQEHFIEQVEALRTAR